ncbi:hypothetical protein ACOSP7_013461 [Xanthoceras sorbifolium]
MSAGQRPSISYILILQLVSYIHYISFSLIQVNLQILMKGGEREKKDRDDQDLVLFRDLHRREKDRMATLLQPVFDDLEPNPGNYALYRMTSGRKGPGYEFFPENDKNDYDWLKTPPATPLFPSLEMEANASNLLLQRDIPILQPLSRFGGVSTATKGGNNIGRPKSPKSKPLRSVTPSHTQRPTIITTLTETKRNKTTTTLNNRKPNVIGKNTDKATSKVHKDTLMDFLTSNLSKNNIAGTDTKTKPRSRGVSPSTRSTIPPDIPGFSNEAPPNLRTDISRSTSATRGRPAASNSTAQTPGFSKEQPPPSTMRRNDINRSTSATRGRPAAANTTTLSKRQSCSPSVTRGRKVTESKQQDQADDQKGKISTTIRNNNSTGTQFVGSRMVDKLMNARSKSGNEDRESTRRPKSRGSVSVTSKTMSRSSLDVSSKQMETKRDRTGSRQVGVVPGKSSTRD